MVEVILRLPAVKTRTGHSKSEIYRRMAAGEFPASISLGARAKGWIEREIDHYVKQLIARSRNGGGTERHSDIGEL